MGCHISGADEVRSERRVALAIRWLVNYARDRSEYTMVDRLAAEILMQRTTRFISQEEKILTGWQKLIALPIPVVTSSAKGE